MNIRVIRVLAMLLPLFLMAACKSSKSVSQKQSPSPILLDFAGEDDVTQEEFERVYAKNNGGLDSAAVQGAEAYQEYLDLYVNFKRKVFAAEALGLDTTAAFKQEFGTYRKQLAQPYLSAKEVEQRLIREAYDRSKSMIKASHILIGATEDASPADTLAAYQKALAIRDSLINGADFTTLAKRHSDDPSAQDNDGNLGYFSVFTMVYPFESAAYQTAVGEVSMPARSQFGYHLVKVYDQIPNIGEKRAAHLIIRVGERYTAKTEEEAETKIQELFAKLKDGADFAELVKQYSDDPSTANRGGDLGTGRLLPEMEGAKLKLGEGEYSDPFQTRFGWHILKVTEVDSLASFEESEPQLKQRISRDSRSQLSREALIRRIKAENQYQLQQETFDAFASDLPESFAKGTWRPDTAQAQQALYQQTLFTLNDDYQASIQDMIDFAQKKRLRFPNLSGPKAAERVLKQYSEQALLTYEEDKLPEKNPEFRNLLQEYRDGILLFTLMEQKVWKKAVEDTTGLKAYYEANQDSFQADQMIDVREFRSSGRDVIEQVETLLTEGKSPEAIDSMINQSSSLAVRITNQTYEKGQGDVPVAFFDAAIGERSDILATNNFFRILVVEKSYPAGIKPFDKAKSEAITKYQDYLEATWLKELAEEYPVTINEAVFEQLFQ